MRSQRIGHGFESHYLHQNKKRLTAFFVLVEMKRRSRGMKNEVVITNEVASLIIDYVRRFTSLGEAVFIPSLVYDFISLFILGHSYSTITGVYAQSFEREIAFAFSFFTQFRKCNPKFTF